MNFRSRATPVTLGFQIAPMVDILLVLLVFFIVTWNFALSENQLDVKLPSAAKASESKPQAGQVVLNIKADGSFVMNRSALTAAQLQEKLTELAKLFPDQAVIVRGDGQMKYSDLVKAMDICRASNVWNIAFATATAAQPTQP